MSEQKLNEELTAIYESFERTLALKNGRVRRSAGASRLTVADVLSKHANDDGTIPISKLNAVLSDMAAVEGELYRNMRDELRNILSASVETTTTSAVSAVVAVLGVATITQFAGLSSAFTAVETSQVELLFAALVGTGLLEFIKRIVEAVFKRRGDDGNDLNDRLRTLAKALNDDIKVTLRQSIQAGEGTTDIVRKVERKFSEFNWRLDTITETESLVAFRQSLARFAEESELVRALKIVDYPHGDPREHRRHKCYVYAQANEHGLGKGVYPVSVRKIRNPHPRCRSTLHFVLYDELK